MIMKQKTETMHYKLNVLVYKLTTEDKKFKIALLKRVFRPQSCSGRFGNFVLNVEVYAFLCESNSGLSYKI